MRRSLLPLTLLPLLLLSGCTEDVPAVICTFELPTPGRISSTDGFNLLVYVKGDFTAEQLPAVHFVSDLEMTGSAYPDGLLLASGINIEGGCIEDPGCPAGARLETPLTPGTHVITAMALTPLATVACQDSVEIRANQAPEVTSISFVPPAPVTGDNLAFTFDDSDAEGDAVSVAAQWTGPDGQTVAGETLSNLNTAAGETWTLSLTPRDAFDTGTAFTAQVTIGNTPPSAPTVIADPVPARENADITCAITNLEDLDPDTEQTLTPNWSWTVDGADAANSTDRVDAADQAAGELWVCTATVSDGTDSSTTGSASATVLPALNVPTFEGFESLPMIQGVGLQRLGSGGQVASPGDLDGDGLADFVLLDNQSVFVGNTGQGQGDGHAWLFSGAAISAGSAPFATTDAATDFFGNTGLRLTNAYGPGDINGDGLADLVIGFKHISLPTSAEGTGIYVVFGTAGGFGASVDLVNGVTYFGGGDEVGQVACPVGDLDGDGRAELAVAAPTAGDGIAGRVYVVYGHGGVWPTDLNPEDLAPGFVVEGTTSGQQLGTSCAGITDIDADGFDDLVVGAPGAGSSGNGRALVYRGEADRWSGSLTSATADVIIDATAAGSSGFGIAVAALGDHDGDGVGDLAFYGSGPDGGTGTEGSIWIASGGAAGFVGAITTADLPYTIEGAGALGFCKVALGVDLDGDGLGDLACSDLTPEDATNLSATPAARVFLGSASLSAARDWSDADYEVLAGAAADRPGAGMAAVADMNGDGYAELLVGAPDRDLVLASNGQATSAPGAVVIVDLN